MGSGDSVETSLLAHFRDQALACEAYGSPFTARLIERMARDLEGRGPVAELVGDWTGNPRADAVALRLAGALHAAALGGAEAELSALYPGPDRGWDMDRLWPVARAYLRREQGKVARFVESPPQTNEVRRSIALLAGFLAVAEQFDGPIETLELGASAGLNMSWDRYAYRTRVWDWNLGARPEIDTEWQGSVPPVSRRPFVRKRAACDQNPLDLRDPEERIRLKSYIWADQPERLARFDAAADLTIAQGDSVDRADAAEWLARNLSTRPKDAAVVVYHSVFLQYPSRPTRAAITGAIEAAGAEATARAPLVWLRYEPEAVLGGPRESMRFFVDLVFWPGGERRVVLETDGHARWVMAL